jgi:hypothetical protein
VFSSLRAGCAPAQAGRGPGHRAGQRGERWLAGLGGGVRPSSASLVSSRRRVRRTASGRPAAALDPHDALVEIFVVGVVAERGVQRGQRLVSAEVEY